MATQMNSFALLVSECSAQYSPLGGATRLEER
jgi:hypothetical protein